MKYILSLLLFFLLTLNLKAQLLIDSTNFPLPTSSYIRNYAGAVTIGAAGPDAHYNFSQVGIAFSDTLNYLDTDSTAFAIEHPGADVSILNDYGDFKLIYYYSRSSTAYWESGVTIIADFGAGLDTLHGNHQANYGDTLISTQFVYGFSTVRHSFVSVPVNPWVDIDFHRVKEIEVDGWGTLSTPYNEFDNVIRIRYVEYRYDSVFIAGNLDNVEMDTLRYYHYYAENVRHPVVIAHVNSFDEMEYIEFIKVPVIIPGCIDPDALNYNPYANQDDGSCLYCAPFTQSVTPDTIICLGDSILLEVTGGTEWNWSTGDILPNIHVQPENSTVYSVLVSQQSNCWQHSSVNVTVEQPVYADFWVSSGFSNISDSVFFINASDNANDYIWYFDDNTNSSSQLENPIHLYDSIGEKEVMLIANNSCFSDTVIYPISIMAIEENEKLLKQIKVYPNPGDIRSVIEYHLNYPADVSFAFTDVNGKYYKSNSIMKKESGTHRMPIDELFNDIPAGIYMIQMKAGDNQYDIKWINVK